jgi:hypothetical protein
MNIFQNLKPIHPWNNPGDVFSGFQLTAVETEKQN